MQLLHLNNSGHLVAHHDKRLLNFALRQIHLDKFCSYREMMISLTTFILIWDTIITLSTYIGT